MGGIAYLSAVRCSRAASTASFMVRRRVGWPMSRQASGESHRGCGSGGSLSFPTGPSRIEVVVREHPYRLELLIPQQVGLVDDQDGGLAALVALGGEHGGGLGGEPG